MRVLRSIDDLRGLLVAALAVRCLPSILGKAPRRSEGGPIEPPPDGGALGAVKGRQRTLDREEHLLDGIVTIRRRDPSLYDGATDDAAVLTIDALDRPGGSLLRGCGHTLYLGSKGSKL